MGILQGTSWLYDALMAKRKKNDDASQEPPMPPAGEKKKPPSREKIRYLAIPLELHELLKRYADEHSDEDSRKSINWAARVAIRRFLQSEGYLGPKRE